MSFSRCTSNGGGGRGGRGGGGGHRHLGAHPALAFDQPPAKRMRTDNNASQNDTCAGASASSSPFPLSSPFQPSGTQTASGQHSHPSFIISPDRDCKLGASGGAGQFAPIACAQHSNGAASVGTNLNSPAPACNTAAALWFGATPAPAAAEGGAVMQITQDSVSDIDEPPPSMHECDESNEDPTPREWWKQRSSTTSAAAAAASLSASSSFSSLAPHGAAVALSAATARCHVCNVNEAPPLESSDHVESYASAAAGTGTAAHHHPSHLHGSPYVANGLSHHSPAFHAAGHHQHANQYNQHMMRTPATTAAAGAPARQKNSLLSYFQVRKAPAVCSTPSRPTSSFSSNAANSSTPQPHAPSAHPTSAPNVGPSVLTCSYCERPSCPSCTRHCQSCSKRYCTFCSTVNYDESREERVFCLDCHLDAHAIGTVAETSSHGGCMDMEE